MPVQLVVGRVGRPHGLRGEVSVEVRTDCPEHRFRPGSVLVTEPAERGPLHVVGVRDQGGRLLVRFAGVSDRAGAEALRGTLLGADSASSPPLADPEEYWDHDLVGLRALTPDGVELGEVTAVLHPPGPTLLTLTRPDRRELLVPFVRDVVPTVDLPGGRLVVTPPAGLLDL